MEAPPASGPTAQLTVFGGTMAQFGPAAASFGAGTGTTSRTWVGAEVPPPTFVTVMLTDTFVPVVTGFGFIDFVTARSASGVAVGVAVFVDVKVTVAVAVGVPVGAATAVQISAWLLVASVSFGNGLF